jgi:hypothetical protein
MTLGKETFALNKGQYTGKLGKIVTNHRANAKLIGEPRDFVLRSCRLCDQWSKLASDPEVEVYLRNVDIAGGRRVKMLSLERSGTKQPVGKAKLVDARQRHRLLVQRHKRATTHERTRGVIERVTRYDAVTKFDQLEQRIERMEAFQEIDPDLQKPSLEEAYAVLKESDAIEEELARLKREPRRPATN